MEEQVSSLVEPSEEEPLTNPNFTMAFEALPLPPLDQTFSAHFPDDLTFGEDALMVDLDDLDFNLDDFLLPSEMEDFPVENRADFPFPVTDSSVPISPRDSENGSSGVDLCGSSSARVSNLVPVTSSQGSPDSGQSLSVHDRDIAGDCDGSDNEPVYFPDSSKSPSEESGEKRNFEGFETKYDSGGYLLKRKTEREDVITDFRSKFQKSISSDADSSCVFSAGNCEEDKKKSRLMRNRESAQLSRQRKKRYVEELEDKLRAMHSTITELNSKLSFFMAENASLRQQLGGFCANPSLYYPQAPMAPVHYPWVPVNPAVGFCSGSQVPLVPIPRLRPQQPAPASKAKKKASKVGDTEGKKHQNKTKKVASVTFFGLFLFLLVFGGLVDFRDPVGSSRLEFVSGGVEGKSKGQVFTITERSNGSESRPLSGTEGFPLPGNASEPLIASLFVPRNDKLVKIDGNLIIHSVLASEKAMGSSQVKSEKGALPSDKEDRKTDLAIPSNMVPALAVPRTGNNVERHSHLYRSLTEHQRALASSSRDDYVDNSKSSSLEGPLHQWFREGLAGPVLSSSICTEVFQFDVSSAIVPATSMANVSADHPVSNTTRSGRIKNRRTLHPAAIPLKGTTLNRTDPTEHTVKSKGNVEFPGNKSMVVSVLVDPRETGDGVDGEEKVLPKSLSRIFVVVLLDSVKYVTYSCVLPLKGSAPHLVTT